MKPSEILLRAKERVEKGWCQGAFAKTIDGAWIGERHGEAAEWCAVGALTASISLLSESGDYLIGDYSMPRWCLMRALAQFDTAPISSLADWNDAPKRTQAEVIEAFEAAYQLAIAEEQSSAS